jgi:ribosomal-protein-alanine N-acetyltransferase
MTLRPLTVFDAAAMSELEKQCFSLPWSLKAITAELKNPIARYYGAFSEGRLIGYAGIQVIVDEGHITNIAADPAHRRKGVADALMTELTALAGERKLSFMTLEVRESNLPAIGLYKKYGFSVAGIRPGYYDEPKEDAVIMTNEHPCL